MNTIGMIGDGEEYLANPSQCFSEMFQHAAIGMIRVSADNVIRDVNRSLAEALDYSVSELIGRSHLSILASNNNGNAMNEWQELTAGARRSYTVDRQLRTKLGGTIFTRATVTRVDLSPASPEIVEIYQDFTDEREALAKLWARDNELRNFVDLNSIGIILCEADGTFVDSNDHFKSLTGYSQVDLNKFKTWAELMMPEISGSAMEQLEQLHGRGRCEPFNVALRHKNGSVIHVLIAGTVVSSNSSDVILFVLDTDSDMQLHRATRGLESMVKTVAEVPWSDFPGQRVAISRIVRDLSDRRCSKTLQLQMFRKQQLEANGRLAGGVAHVFNNLMMIISSHTEILEQRLTEQRSLDNLSKITEAARRGAELTKQLLTFSGKQRRNLQLLSLDDVLHETFDDIRRLIGKELSLELHAGSKDLIKMDYNQLREIIFTLCQNARDAMPDGGSLRIAAETITVGKGPSGDHLLPTGKYAVLRVRDSGRGMTESVKSRIFEPFFSTKEGGRGTGLAMATVYGIVKQSEGFIYVDSEPNQGSNLSVYFPVSNQNG